MPRFPSVNVRGDDFILIKTTLPDRDRSHQSEILHDFLPIFLLIFLGQRGGRMPMIRNYILKLGGDSNARKGSLSALSQLALKNEAARADIAAAGAIPEMVRLLGPLNTADVQV